MSKKPDPGMRCFSNSPTAADTAHCPRQQSPNTHERAHRAFWQRFLAHALRNGAGGDGDAIPSNLTPGERSIVGTYHDASSTLTFARFSLSHSHDTSGPAGAADILAAATAAEPPRSEREPLDRGRQ